MDTKTFETILNETLDKCQNTLGSKAKEYATQDRLHNFKQAAALQQCTQAQALLGMMTKHIVSIYDMVYSGEQYLSDMWDEKIGDSINYHILLRAVVSEDNTK